MANVMSLKNLRNKVSRNGYDLSFKNAFTAKVGEILPVGVWMGLPGDKFRFNLNWFTRTQPVNTAAYARIREYYDFYVVPISQMWRDAPSFFVNVPDYISSKSLTQAPVYKREQHPYFTSDSLFTYLYSMGDGNTFMKHKNNFFGYSRALQTCKLLEYLGYGRFYDALKRDYSKPDGSGNGREPNRLLNPFPLLAYQKIYNDYFRFNQWELSQPNRYNVDYVSSSRTLQIPITDLLDKTNDYANLKPYNFLDLNYCNWNRDYFMGVLPRAQYGDEAYATPLVGQGSVNIYGLEVDESGDGTVNINFDEDGHNSYGLGAIAIRRAEFMQRYKEISITGEQNYKDQIAKHWNVSVSDYLSGKCKYLGGTSSNIDIGEVVNSNLTGDSQADIAGKGTSAGRGNISYDVKEHCIIMCVYHCVPLLDYTSDIPNPLIFSNNFTDYPIPEMDKIGMEQIYVGDMLAWTRHLGPSDYNLTEQQYLNMLKSPIGWAPRYYTYKTTFDQVRGGFCDTLLSWVVPMSPKYLTQYFTKQYVDNQSDNFVPKIDYSFFKVSPNIVDPIFAVNSDGNINTDQFLVNSFFDTKVVRNLDYDGLPY